MDFALALVDFPLKQWTGNKNILQWLLHYGSLSCVSGAGGGWRRHNTWAQFLDHLYWFSPPPMVYSGIHCQHRHQKV